MVRSIAKAAGFAWNSFRAALVPRGRSPHSRRRAETLCNVAALVFLGLVVVVLRRTAEGEDPGGFSALGAGDPVARVSEGREKLAAVYPDDGPRYNASLLKDPAFPIETAVVDVDVYLFVPSAQPVAGARVRETIFSVDQIHTAVQAILTEPGPLPSRRLTVVIDATSNKLTIANISDLVKDDPRVGLRVSSRNNAATNIWVDSYPDFADGRDLDDDRITQRSATLFLTPDAFPDMQPGFLQWTVEAVAEARKLEIRPAIAGVSPLTRTSLDDEHRMMFSTRAFAPLRSSWRQFLRAYKSVTTQEELSEWDPFDANRMTYSPLIQPLAKRVRNKPTCTTLAPELMRARETRFVVGLPEGSRHLQLKGDTFKKCAGRTDQAEQRMIYATFFTRYMLDYNLRTVWRRDAVGPTASVQEEHHKHRSKFYLEHQKEIDEIVQAGQSNGGTIALTLVNEAFLPFAFSFYCNMQMGNFWPPSLSTISTSIVWMTTDKSAEAALGNLSKSKVVVFDSTKLGVGRPGEPLHYKTAGYWAYMLARTLVVREVLRQGVSVFLFDLDQVWLSDPWPHMPLPENDGTWDIVGTRGYSTSPTGGEIQGNFLMLKATTATRGVWEEISRRFEHNYTHCCGTSHGPIDPNTHVEKMEQDQYLLSYLVAFSKWSWVHPLRFVQLDRTKFVDGKWYQLHEPGKVSESHLPISIQNNWIVGAENKTARAQLWSHWFYKRETHACDAESARHALHPRIEHPLPAADQPLPVRQPLSPAAAAPAPDTAAHSHLAARHDNALPPAGHR